MRSKYSEIIKNLHHVTFLLPQRAVHEKVPLRRTVISWQYSNNTVAADKLLSADAVAATKLFS